MSVLNDSLRSNKYSMSVMPETFHVPMAGEHAPTAEAAMQLAMAASRSCLVVYTVPADERTTFNVIIHTHT